MHASSDACERPWGSPDWRAPRPFARWRILGAGQAHGAKVWLADLVQPAHGGTFGCMAERLELLIPGFAKGE